MIGTFVENRLAIALLLIGVASFTTLPSSAQGERCYLYVDQREGEPYDPDHSVCAEFLRLLTKHCPAPRDLMCEEHRTNDLPELGRIPWKTLNPADHLKLVEAIVRSAWLFESAQEAGWRKKKTKVLHDIRKGTLQLRVAKLDIDRDGETEVIVELQQGRCFSKDYEKQIVVTAGSHRGNPEGCPPQQGELVRGDVVQPGRLQRQIGHHGVCIPPGRVSQKRCSAASEASPRIAYYV